VKTASLRLGPLPDTAVHKLSVALPANVKTQLDRYAEIYSATYGRKVEPAELIPYIVSTFIARDRQYRRMAVRQSEEP
jgi:hypothetical protein